VDLERARQRRFVIAARVVAGVEYDDGLIACASDALVIRRYTVLLGTRRIPYGEIRRVTTVHLGGLRKWRIWGGDVRHWFNFDAGRLHKPIALVLDVGKSVKPTITPDDPAQVLDVLRRHGIQVSQPA
jgi:hypothetical protein